MTDRHYIMIGAPVTSVRTPRLLEARMAAAGIDATVEVRHVEPDDLPALMRRVRDDLSVDGLMVTMPHKRAVMAHLAEVSAAASLIGSVNSVKRLASGKLVGAQFDGVALVRALRAAGQTVEGANILLAGFGGAGTAIAHALMVHGCAGLTVHDLAMDDSAINVVLKRLSSGLADAKPAAAVDGDRGYDILINATPLGMQSGDPSVFSSGQVAAARCVADIVADPPATRLAALANEVGATLVTGRAMVTAQIDPIFDWLVTGDLEQ